MLQDQALSIAHLVFLGVTLGMLIDIYRVTLALARPGKYLSVVFDISFWLVTALWVFVYLLGVTSGETRLYMLLLLFTGYILEQRILGLSLRISLRSTALAVGKLLVRFIEGAAMCVDAVLDVVLTPYRFLYRLILRPIRLVCYYALLPFRYVKKRIRMLDAYLREWWKGDEPKEI